jgi:hypothetical protein
VRRITILIGALAALMLVPAASAFASPSMKVNVTGPGSGEVTSGFVLEGTSNEPIAVGTPPMACSYNGASQGGTCLNTPEESNPGKYTEWLVANPAPGSEFGGWVVQRGEEFNETEFECEPNGTCEGFTEYCPGGQSVHEETGFKGSQPMLECGFGSKVVGEPNEWEVQATFCAEGTAKEEETYNAYWEVNEMQLVGCEAVTPPSGPPLTTIIEEGSGTVVSNPAGIECTGAAPHECTTEEIAAGEHVTLTASPAAGYLFKSWKNCDTGGVNGRQCTITLTEGHKPVGAKFVKAFSLEGSKSNPNGIFSTAPGGVNCGYGCNSSSALYKEGALTVKAKPAKNFHFVEFTGGTGSAASCNGVTAETCSIATFNSNSSIEEVYAENAKNTLTLAKEGGGQGFVKTKPTNINCGYTCTAAEAEFFASETVPVTVTLNKGTTSVTWTTPAGTCTGNALTCEVPMSAAHSLVAKFE